MNPNIVTRVGIAGITLAATAALVGCASEDTSSAEAAADQPTSIETVAGPITLPEGAWSAAESAAEECEAVTPQLIAGTIATLSGYDAEYSDASGRAGYSAQVPVQWERWGTDAPEDRSDLTAANQALGKQLCSAFDSAASLADDPSDDFQRESVALAVVLAGEKYVEREGVPAIGDRDPHLVRAQVSDILTAADSVATA
ncbi:hypothetical protein [Corynebacterium kalidii]